MAPLRLTTLARVALRLLLAVSCLALAPGDQQVVRVDSTSFALSDIQAWLDALPAADVPSGAAPRSKRVRHVIDEVFVPQALLTEHAADTIGADDAFSPLRDQVLARAVERLLQDTVEVGQDEIAAFYQEHRERYVRPKAILIWRILVREEAEAKKILAAVADNRLGVYEWGNLARIHSIDEATKHRDGSLGFVRADGTTDVPQVRVDRAVYEAAQPLKDGQIAPNPVREGDAFALVWRRGTRPEMRESMDQQSQAITAVLTRHKVQRAREALLADLRERYLSEYKPELLETIVYHLPLEAASEAATIEPAPIEPTDPKPRQSDRGER